MIGGALAGVRLYDWAMTDERAEIDVRKAMEVARRAVSDAGAAALGHFQGELEVERKADSSPVTVADREAEAAVLEVIRSAFPEHSILGEETGEHAGESRARWIIDPIDGTKGFTRGGTHWGPLVALELDGEVLAGAMALPALGKTYWAGRGLGAHRDGVRLQVSSTAHWGEATLSLGEMQNLLAPPFRDPVLRLLEGASATRCEGDLASCAMLLDGRADAWLEAGVCIWDVAPLKILVEEARGRFTSFSGADVLDGASVAATNGLLHEHVLSTIGAELSLEHRQR